MTKTIALAVSVGLAMTLPAAAQSPVTPEEVVVKVREAAAYLEEKGKAGLATFDRGASPFVWKDTYVFVLDCDRGTTVAHPEASTRGTDLATLKDKTGKLFGPAMCAAAERPDGGWIEYMWPKPVSADTGNSGEMTYAAEPSRKVTYMHGVPGQPYQVGAGIYNEPLTVEELDRLVE